FSLHDALQIYLEKSLKVLRYQLESLNLSFSVSFSSLEGLTHFLAYIYPLYHRYFIVISNLHDKTRIQLDHATLHIFGDKIWITFVKKLFSYVRMLNAFGYFLT